MTHSPQKGLILKLRTTRHGGRVFVPIPAKQPAAVFTVAETAPRKSITSALPAGVGSVHVAPRVPAGPLLLLLHVDRVEAGRCGGIVREMIYCALSLSLIVVASSSAKTHSDRTGTSGRT